MNHKFEKSVYNDEPEYTNVIVPVKKIS